MTGYWLMKCEPDAYSIDDMEADGRCFWEGVRNYQARNFMRDGMKKGDLVLFYHSNTKPPGVVGVIKVVKEAYPDHTAWEKGHKYFDKKASPENPIWCMVDVAFVKKFPRLVSLTELKEEPKLEGMQILRKGNRLSITPLDKKHFDFIVKMSSK